jgi:cellulose synthase/poly-beta-1,6-N-acetylglucosamine synthase-like glycosyltransferase
MTGTMVPEALTRNALIRTDVFNRVGLFDARFAATGNEDRDLFARLHESGGTICWSDEAVVEEHVPASHTTVGYFLRGAYRKANANAIRTSQSRASSLMQVGGGLLLSTKGIYLLLASMTRGKVETVKALQRIWSGAGTMAGALVQRGGQLQTIQSA